MSYKLGKAPAKVDIRTARLEFFMGGFPIPPKASSGVNKGLMASCGMLGNDAYGDCVVADDGHRIMLWTKLTGTNVAVSDAEALSNYQAASMALNHSSADQGLVMLDYNKWRMQTPWKNRSFYGFGTVDHMNHQVVKQLIIAFGAVALGILLPQTAQSQPAPGGTWSLVSRNGSGAPGTWGGHDVPAIDYDEGGVYVVTWGGVQYLTWDFFDYYVDECYAIIPTDPVPGFDLNGFISYLQSLGAYVGPGPLPNPPTPVPVTVSMAVNVQPSNTTVGVRANSYSVKLLLADGTVNLADNSTTVTSQLIGFSNKQTITAVNGVVTFAGDVFTNPHTTTMYSFSATGLATITSNNFVVNPVVPNPPPPTPSGKGTIMLTESTGATRKFNEV